MKWSGVIVGEPVSKANSRKLAHIGGQTRFIKSDKALRYVRDAQMQVRPLGELLTGDLRFTATLYYASNRPDLDPSLLLDALQGRVYRNDRQCRELHLYHRIDRANPRAEIVVETIEATS